MFKKFLRCLIAGGSESKPKSKQSKRQDKQIHPQTTPAERKRMLELRQRGQSVHAIAGTMNRSSRTVHQVLTKRGTQPLPDPEEPFEDSEISEQEEGSLQKNRRRKSGGNFIRGGEEVAESFLRDFGPTLNRLVFEAMKGNDDLVLQFFANQTGVKIPKKTVDDIVHEEIKNNPDLRRQVADDYLERRRRMGRTETEIAEEVLDLAVKIAGIMERGRWPDVVEKAVTSGEIGKILEIWRGKEPQELHTQPGPTLPRPQIQPQGNSEPSLSTVPECEPTMGPQPLSGPGARTGNHAPQSPFGGKL